MAHISFRRIDPDEIWGWDHVAIAHRIASRFADFAEDAPANRLHPDFKGAALRENLEYRANKAGKEHVFESAPNHPVGTPISAHVWIRRQS